jgi:hypothetical protein
MAFTNDNFEQNVNFLFYIILKRYNIKMRIEDIAGRCKLAARSLTISGLYALLNYRDYYFSPQEEIAPNNF